ncbi:unnamed protein product [Urochloa humidicola]
MMAEELVKQYSNITLGEDSEICDIKLVLKALRKKILSLDFDNSMHVHDPQDSFEYLEVLYKIRRLSERLKSLDPCGEAKQLDELTVYADDLSEMAMARLEEEFVYLLTHYKQPIQQEVLSFRSTEDGSVEDFSSSSFSEEQSEGKATPSDVTGGPEYFVPDLIQPGYDDMILNEYHEALLQLGESARKTFAEFKYAIQSYTSSSAVARGEVHPLTKYVMNYIRALTAYSKTLDSLFKDTDRRQLQLASEIQLMANAYPNFTATALHLQSVAAILEANLEAGSRLYRDDRLQNIFMMNNIHYMVQKVKNSDLKSFLGDDWIRVHNRKFQQQAMRYERASWNTVLSYLSDDGLCAAGDAASRKTIREKIKNFYLSFEEVYRVQTAWSVPDDQLRDDIRISISLKVIQAYRTFVGRYSNFLDGSRHRDRYIKYRPEDLETLLLDLFEGAQKSLAAFWPNMKLEPVRG